MPTLELEKTIIAQTRSPLIAGIDEAGRGALAGPVVAAAVILPLTLATLPQLLHEVKDSKKLTPQVRERLYDLITRHALTYATGAVAAQEIDRTGILPATKAAMTTAVSQLAPAPGYLLIDGRIRLRNLPTRQQAVIRGDDLSLSIAAASILAKVTRDRYMIALDPQYPPYGFARHKGYSTRQHLEALARYGPSPVHRHTFAPIRQQLL